MQPQQLDVAPLFATYLFRKTWSFLAEQGKCDALDSQQYRRVYGQYERDAYPWDPWEFILTHTIDVPPDQQRRDA